MRAVSLSPVENRTEALAAGSVSLLIIQVLILFVIAALMPRTAFAAEAWTYGTFEYNGQKYPATLAGVVVTFNNNPSAPNTYIGKTGDVPLVWTSGTWYNVGGYNVTDYSGNEVLARVSAPYFISEASTVNNPWYVGWNATGNTSVSSALQYYNGGVSAWYAHSGTKSRTYQFGGTLGSMSPNSNLLLHHDFIRYVVDNSDFRTRYTLPSDNPTLDVTTTYGTDTITVSWSGNPDIWVQRREGTDNWVSVQYVPAPSPYVYNVPSSGTYRVIATQSGYQDYTSGGQTFTIAGITFVDGSVVMAPDYSTLTVTAHFLNPQPVSVRVEVAENNPLSSDYGEWRQLLPVLTYDSGTWSYTYSWSEADRYSRVRIVARDATSTQTFDLGVTESWVDDGDFDFIKAIDQVRQWIHQFVGAFGDLFAWLPTEIRVLLVSVFTVMVILGLIGWLKS